MAVVLGGDRCGQKNKKRLPKFGSRRFGVEDGARTHDTQNHNLVLCQLSYIHHVSYRTLRGKDSVKISVSQKKCENTYCFVVVRAGNVGRFSVHSVRCIDFGGTMTRSALWSQRMSIGNDGPG